MNKIILSSFWVLLLPALTASNRGCRTFFLPHHDPNSPPAYTENTKAVPKETAMDASKPQSPMPQTERQWKQKLTRQQYYVLRQKGTERPFTGKYDHFFEEGVYKCAGCGAEIFSSDAKYNSGCGWPAFSAPAEKDAVAERRDTTLGMVRTEIYCPKCGGHLGHVFNDGPAPTGQRYCINSAALDFEQKDSKTEPRQ
jgi:peptide-methionine (R)-S-oxide reductase